MVWCVPGKESCLGEEGMYQIGEKLWLFWDTRVHIQLMFLRLSFSGFPRAFPMFTSCFRYTVSFMLIQVSFHVAFVPQIPLQLGGS